MVRVGVLFMVQKYSPSLFADLDSLWESLYIPATFLWGVSSAKQLSIMAAISVIYLYESLDCVHLLHGAVINVLS